MDIEAIQIPNYTREDYLEGTAPYEFLYQFTGDPFVLERLAQRMGEQARRLRVYGFKRTFGEYAKKQQALLAPACGQGVTRFVGQPLELATGPWRADGEGVAIFEGYREMEACNHPILPVMRLVNIDTGVEKMVLAFCKGGRWRQITAEKRTLASRREILELANAGVAVTSETAGTLVRYLHDIEGLNYEQIPERRSVGRLGWIEGEGFSPYVEELVFDGDQSFRPFFESVRTRGEWESWLAVAREVRAGEGIAARMALAASFASALVGPLGCLPFFLHLWGGTETGKTVGLMLAASVWADPEMGRYIHTFNSTAVGRERSAAFCNALPLVLDELQIAKDKQTFDKDIYLLAEGVGRTRGTREGGTDRVPTWHNCILTSGEMPITGAFSGGGAVNRILEVECGERLFADPRRVAAAVRLHHGHAGRRFVQRLDGAGLAEAAALFEGHRAALGEGDATEKQAMAAALLLTADELATRWLFADGRALERREVAEHLRSRASVDQNGRCYDYLCEYAVQNRHRFCGESEQTEVWGALEPGRVYMVRSAFDRICREAGYDPRAFLSWARQAGRIDVRPGKGFTLTRRINHAPCHCVALRLPGEEDDRAGEAG